VIATHAHAHDHDLDLQELLLMVELKETAGILCWCDYEMWYSTFHETEDMFAGCPRCLRRLPCKPVPGLYPTRCCGPLAIKIESAPHLGRVLRVSVYSPKVRP